MTVMSLISASRPTYILNNLVRRDNSQLQQIIRTLRTSGTKFGGGHDRTLQILPSRYQWHKFKDLFHFYFFLGVIPLTAVVVYANIFIGPATLCEIPEGYEPEDHEYFRHPITRYLVKNYITTMQESYERNMHYLVHMEQKRRMRLLATRVEALMRERGDYPNYYTTRTIHGKYARAMQIERDYIQSTTGEE
ncbi:NADH dehydrogenase [ubiquinone] 1 beta subcomplex subunit 5, mitochondrial [Orchesella cincta]|uniref:NADH dehydrogenase [ubiquinone] 1 beta subcomplex subunit 5, mitochondrial n=1 Tax=Orchesella cincta TaxID=48709 RepID=A0A1D2N4P6_ORCCI|nr:NADH dehydrogenase [ubiquinone] 1 beta subcomplex subunit 5, mitochondrial [Orchesella cincta]